jgi:hypothetical protein
VWAVPSEQAVGQNLRQRRATKALTGLTAPTYAVLLRLFVWTEAGAYAHRGLIQSAF